MAIDETVDVTGCGEIIIFVDYTKGSETGAFVFPYVLIPGGDPESSDDWYPLVGRDVFKGFIDVQILPMTESKKYAFWVKVPSMFEEVRVMGDLSSAGDGELVVSCFPVRSLTPFD